VRDTFDLDDYLGAEAGPVNGALERAVARLTPFLDADVAAAVGHGVLSQGKRLRPILCVTAYTACGGGRVGALYDLAAALEMVHAYSLMHDDLPCMDDADLRRGRPTTHKAYGEDATLRAGAALIPAAAFQVWTAARALGCAPAVARKVTRTLLDAAGAGGMVGGQWLDLEAEGRALGPDDLDDLHARKTGALLAAALLVGATAAGASADVLRSLDRYGRAVGLAFQIADDILDATESAETLGKNPSDAALDKSTYVSLHGLGEARRRAGTEVREAMSALDQSGLEAPALAALARYVVERRR
jgi:geranylgeranyl pyrophosphate synthase